MKTTVQIVALLALIAATAASEYQCSLSYVYINCAGKNITAPPSGYWPQISALSISDTQISNLYTNAFSGFPNLYVLYMHNTPVTSLDLEVFSGATNKLQTLQLQKSHIESVIPATSDVRFDELQVVNFEHSRVSSFHPDSFKKAAKLDTLILNYNPVVVPEGQPIVNSESLQVLEMINYSTLGNLGPASFAGVPNLRVAWLESAKITSINGAFATTNELQYLILNLNLIREVTVGTFAANNTLEVLELKHNPLQRLDVAALQGVFAEEGLIDITNTPLACSSGYGDLQVWAQENGVKLRAECIWEWDSLFESSKQNL